LLILFSLGLLGKRYFRSDNATIGVVETASGDERVPSLILAMITLVVFIEPVQKILRSQSYSRVVTLQIMNVVVYQYIRVLNVDSSQKEFE
jgi:hypothetical protein